MRRVGWVVVALFLLTASSAFADVTLIMSVAMNAGPMVINTSMVTRIKGMKMRTDTKVMEQDTSVFLDVAAKQQWLVTHSTKQIASFDPQAMMANMPVSFGEAAVSIKPNGQTKELLGRSCNGYALELSIPMTLGEEAVMMRMSGVAWITKEAPGVEEYRALNTAAVAAGLAPSPLGQGPQGRAMIELQRAMADAGVPYLQEIQLVMEGSGEMAAAMSQMGAMTMTTTVTAISTDPIPDATFVLPEGYTRK